LADNDNLSFSVTIFMVWNWHTLELMITARVLAGWARLLDLPVYGTSNTNWSPFLPCAMLKLFAWYENPWAYFP
jgi:hypothetical protein